MRKRNISERVWGCGDEIFTCAPPTQLGKCSCDVNLTRVGSKAGYRICGSRLQIRDSSRITGHLETIRGKKSRSGLYLLCQAFSNPKSSFTVYRGFCLYRRQCSACLLPTIKIFQSEPYQRGTSQAASNEQRQNSSVNITPLGGSYGREDGLVSFLFLP
jgi:hypothetical protein